MSDTTNGYNPYEFERSSRSASPSQTGADLIDLSYMDLEECGSLLDSVEEKRDAAAIAHLLLNNNLLIDLSASVCTFENLITVDISCNNLSFLSDDLCKLRNLRRLIAKENRFDDLSLPKSLGEHLNANLEVLNLSGNMFTQFPPQVLDCGSLKELYLGGNKIAALPKNYDRLRMLEVLYLGGNYLINIPEELSQLINLTTLNLSNNRVQFLPSSLARMKNLRTLSLHNNNLTTLPIELVKLDLAELSLRSNPLVSRFIMELDYSVPSLLELTGRLIKSKDIYYDYAILPSNLVNYLQSANCCLNPKCKGVYFTSKIEHVKFVDFCGKYRVPLMQYLCSPKCNQRVAKYSTSSSSSGATSESDEDADSRVDKSKLKKVLLG